MHGNHTQSGHARIVTWAAAFCLPLLSGEILGQQGDGTHTSARNSIVKPAKLDATPERIAKLAVPSRFAVTVFASGLRNSRVLAVADDGTVYVSRRDQGDVLMLKDADGDGRADGAPVVVANRPGAHGLAIKDGKLYIATVKEVFVASIQSDGRLGPLTMLIGDLPVGGQHPNRTIAFGPDGMLYISIGSTCNACNETNQESAALLRASPDGKSRTIFASGPRNLIGFDWHPATGELWGMDHGIDSLGDEIQPEELNRIERGKQYGWPHVWGAGELNPQTTPQGEISKETWKSIGTPWCSATRRMPRRCRWCSIGADRCPGNSSETRSSRCEDRGTRKRLRDTRSCGCVSRPVSRSRSRRSSADS